MNIQVSQELANLKNDSDSMSTLVSLRRLSVLSTSFQFFILACISPYLEKGLQCSDLVEKWSLTVRPSFPSMISSLLQGVGIPLQLRSQIIKSWEQCAGDLEFRKSQVCAVYTATVDRFEVQVLLSACLQLTNAAQCIVTLLGCNDAVRAEILRKYCSDIICTFEQVSFILKPPLQRV